MNRNKQGMKTLSLALAAATYAGAVLYGDIMFLQVMSDVFPSGILGALAMGGALMTAVSALTLPLALHFWLAPGLQFIAGVIFWAFDVAILALNSILAYAVAAGGPIDPNLALWADFAPASPLVAVIGWGLIFLLDPSHKLRHAQAELESDLIDIHAEQLRQAARSEDVYKMLTAGAVNNAAEMVGALTHLRPGTIETVARDPDPANETRPAANGAHRRKANPGANGLPFVRMGETERVNFTNRRTGNGKAE